jgi:DNA-binding response OmpR family regulator
MKQMVGKGNMEIDGAHHPPGSGSMQPKTILIVDDELSILVPLQFLLEKEGYATKLAQSGKEAIETIDRVRPDLILLDIMLPDLDGYEIYQMIRQRSEWQTIRIIFLTAKNRDVDMARGLAMGADAYITKPFSNAQLIQKIGELIGPGQASPR